MNLFFSKSPLALALLAAALPTALAAAQTPTDPSVSQAGTSSEVLLDPTLVTAEQELKQAPGVSVITAEDIRKAPPVNDLSDIIRKMPGVNLTGNSASGVRGNNRQIDIRGMGPENTLILVDGLPVTSRNSIRYGRTGDRDTRGDTNWVPAEQVERIEVIRGPAAARYGNGAAGGVVNIITKAPTKETHGTFSVYTSMPKDSDEGATKRANFGLSGPLTDRLSYRMYGNLSKTDRDSSDINEGHEAEGEAAAAGAEGVRNADFNGRLTWKLDDRQSLDMDAAFSRQGNIYAGDTQYNYDLQSNPKAASASPWVGRETNKLYRQNFALTHNGDWDFGTSKFFVQYEHTRNRRLDEGLTGGVEGTINSTDFSTSDLKSYLAHGEFNLPLATTFEQTLTVGGEWNRQELDDPASTSQALSSGSYWSGSTGSDSIAGVPSGTRSSATGATIGSLFLEDNLEPWAGTVLTPGLRMDQHSDFGVNWSPSFNLSQRLTEDFTLKAGIARAFKAPNLYQLNPNYLLLSSGNGCPVGSSGSCYILGNEDLKAETSVNKELGIEFKRDGYIAGLTFFRNDYHNKVVAGTDVLGYSSAGNMILKWVNAKKAVTQGLEANLTVPVTDSVTWTTNATYMMKNEDLDTGNVLSMIPKYTVNSMLDWQATEKLSTQLSVTSYGRQKPPTTGTTKVDAAGVVTDEVGSYSLVNLNMSYQLTKNLRVGGGVTNLFDKKLYRAGNSNSAGAATYNQHGQALYFTTTASF
ncbi:FepA family TonB-dependent siderophore receptor [Pseudomonas massiliensis]|uniref:FepA family TonB-dependent siderophore receptor n=1 Tax=Pseudomonas massiliensis TaxID=522492 RepID=UPI000A04322D